MALMQPRTRVRLAVGALALLLAAAAVDAWRWRQKTIDNAAIAAGIAARPEPTARAELRFAYASGLTARAEHEAAVDAFRLLHAETPLGQAARFNAANHLMAQALLLRASPLPGQALPLIELAKSAYREVLRTDPENWDARYNLDRAQRLQPDPDDTPPDAAGPPEQAERAATTMRGISRGLP
jgi:mxaK protein